MKLISVLRLLAVAIFFTQTSLACLPVAHEKFEHTRERVKEKFDSVDSVELMTLLDEQWVEIRMYGDDQPTKVLRATFRVDRVFKGNSKPGDIVIFNSTSMCLRSAVAASFVPPGVKIKPHKPSREWIIYRKAAHQTADYGKIEPTFWPNEIQHSPLTQPVNEAEAEVKLLEELVSERVQKQTR
ncbi:hypothetical protein [Undibacterium macrobrachii]|jgi:hypothetical protein|uniref:Uncharacterized protein n=1 Tax=Undibacterium macrobrachii TaxID=1119058 RepID=A0ABQ2XAP7_9BURK|nr:hypothetical protein [Undibacterium macrobrachii]GGX08101.1 hypothetical protein GCM10011282_12650 [Undibacterium macrobrachii]